MARFKTFDQRLAPKNWSAEELTPRGEPGLIDAKVRALMAAIASRLVRERITSDEALYLRAYVQRMRTAWGPWLDSTSVNYILLGGTEEIRSHERHGRWASVIQQLKEVHDAA